MKKDKTQKYSILLINGFFVILISIAVLISIKNSSDMEKILEDSVKSQLISISVAARGFIDIDKFDLYNSIEDIEKDSDAYYKTLANLRELQHEEGATYIYALKKINDEYYFVFDTDPEDSSFLDEPYELSTVHEQAFLGKKSAGILNVSDEWGNYNTGAIPIFKNGKVIGIICTDIDDTYIRKSNSAALLNILFLITSMVVTMGVMSVIIYILLRRVKEVQDKLFRMANYDVLTGLPNRQYLMEHLASISAKSKKTQPPYALFFIDLDNFKKVNDNAGHDAGDELLRNIAEYLTSINENSKSFRPAAGTLNISARIGGDEFVQVIPGIASVEEAEAIAKKLLDNFSSQTLAPYIEKYGVGFSIGAALFPQHSDNFNVLIKYADIAMYHAKNGGKSNYRIFNFDMEYKNEK